MFTMIRKVLPLAVSVLLLAAGCQAGGEIQVDESDDGGQVTLETGQTLVVTLPSNVTTGFRWTIETIDPAFLSQAGEAEYASEAGDGVVGAGGTETFRFNALAAGQTRLVLVYHQAFDPEAEPADRFSMTIEVR